MKVTDIVIKGKVIAYLKSSHALDITCTKVEEARGEKYLKIDLQCIGQAKSVFQQLGYGGHFYDLQIPYFAEGMYYSSIVKKLMGKTMGFIKMALSDTCDPNLAVDDMTELLYAHKHADIDTNICSRMEKFQGVDYFSNSNNSKFFSEIEGQSLDIFIRNKHLLDCLTSWDNSSCLDKLEKSLAPSSNLSLSSISLTIGRLLSRKESTMRPTKSTSFPSKYILREINEDNKQSKIEESLKFFCQDEKLISNKAKARERLGKDIVFKNISIKEQEDLKEQLRKARRREKLKKTKKKKRMIRKLNNYQQKEV